MKIVVNNKAITKDKLKKVMDCLMNIIQDPKTSAKDRKEYYSEYLKISADYLILSR
jgi:hypothetical protein